MSKNEQYDKVIFECNHFMISEEIIEGRKTPILHIYDIEGHALGDIRWDGTLRKFCFVSKHNITWDDRWLVALVVFIEKYNNEWKKTDKTTEKSKTPASKTNTAAKTRTKAATAGKKKSC